MSSRIDCPFQPSAHIFIQHFGGREPLKHFLTERLTAGLGSVRSALFAALRVQTAPRKL